MKWKLLPHYSGGTEQLSRHFYFLRQNHLSFILFIVHFTAILKNIQIFAASFLAIN